MGNVNDALKELFLALGGNPSILSDNHAIEDYVRDIEQALIDSIKAELPKVSATDNGKVLSVVNGAWDKTAASAAEPFDVVYTCTEARGTHTLSKTPAQILEAYNAGRVVRFISTADNYFGEDQYDYDIKLTMNGVFKYSSSDAYYLSFCGYCNGFAGDERYLITVAISDQGDVDIVPNALY